MNFTLFIAKRYLFAKKSTNIINILSILSLVGVLLSTATLVIVIAGFNGLEQQILDAYNPISPDIRITPFKGKIFARDKRLETNILSIPGVEQVLPVISERVVLEFEERIVLANALGVPKSVTKVYALDSLIAGGAFYTEYADENYVVLGEGLASRLQMGLFAVKPLTIYALKRGRMSTSNLANSFSKRYVRPAGYFDGYPEFSANSLFIGFDFAKELFRMEDKISFWDIKVNKGNSVNEVMRKLEELLGAEYVVKNRFQLNETLFRILKIEKFFVFATLALIFLIATFNIVGALSMIISDKKEDTKVLEKLGATPQIIIRIFTLEALLISLIGTFLGLLLGLLLCLLQDKYGLVLMQINTGAFPFPVLISFFDLVLILLITLGIGLLVSVVAVKSIVKSLF